MKHKKLIIAASAAACAVLAIVIVLLAVKPGKASDTVSELDKIDPTDMSQYFAMSEFYPPNSITSININWQGGRVEIIAYNGDDYFVEEAATRYLRENERLDYSLENNVFSVSYLKEGEEIDDAYKKLEIRVPKALAEKLTSINISNDGEVVMKNITVGSITVNGGKGKVTAVNAYSNATNITTTDGLVSLAVDPAIGYSVNFSSKSGKLDSYVDNGMDSYVSGDGKYPFKVKTKTADLDITLAETVE